MWPWPYRPEAYFGSYPRPLAPAPLTGLLAPQLFPAPPSFTQQPSAVPPTVAPPTVASPTTPQPIWPPRPTPGAGLVEKALFPDPPPVAPRGGLLDWVAFGDFLRREQQAAQPRLRRAALPEELRQIRTGPGSSLFGKIIEEITEPEPEPWDEKPRAAEYPILRPFDERRPPWRQPIESWPTAMREPAMRPMVPLGPDPRRQPVGQGDWLGTGAGTTAEGATPKESTENVGAEDFKETHKWLDRYFSRDPDENKPSAVVVDTPDGPHIAVEPVTGRPWTLPAMKAPRYSAERAQNWKLTRYTPPGEADIQGMRRRERAGERINLDEIARSGWPRMGQPVVIRYPNGDMHITRHKETGEELKVGGGNQLVIDAEEAERLGLGDWMIHTRPKPKLPVYMPSDLPLGDPSDRRRMPRRDIARFLSKEILSVLPELFETEAEKRARELYTPRP